MLWIFILGFVAVILWITAVLSSPHERVAAFFIGGLMIFAGAAMASFIINCIAFSLVDTHWETRGSFNLQAIQDTGQGRESFFLGSGTYEEEPVFWYYVDRGGYSTLEYADADDSQIVQDGKSMLEIQKEVSENPMLAVNMDGSERYVFHVPEGSITNQFVLDAKP